MTKLPHGCQSGGNRRVFLVNSIGSVQPKGASLVCPHRPPWFTWPSCHGPDGQHHPWAPLTWLRNMR